MESYVTNSQFFVYIGTESYGFSKISGLREETEYESIREGGRNWSPLFFEKGKSKPDILTLESGVRTSNATRSKNWIKRGTKLEGVVIIFGRNGGKILGYTFDEGIVTKIEYGDLNALGNEILIKKLEIAHSGLYETEV